MAAVLPTRALSTGTKQFCNGAHQFSRETSNIVIDSHQFIWPASYFYAAIADETNAGGAESARSSQTLQPRRNPKLPNASDDDYDKNLHVFLKRSSSVSFAAVPSGIFLKFGRHPRNCFTMADAKLSTMQERLKSKLSGSKFRWINEQMYTSRGEEALEMLQSDPDLFQEV